MLHEIGPEFERTSGHKLTVVSGSSTQFLTMINSGEPFDVVVTASPIVDQLIKDGKVIANTRADLARSGIGVEVRAGAPKPDISSVEAFKRALLNAKSIGYLKVGSVSPGCTAGPPRYRRGYRAKSQAAGYRYGL